MWQISKSREERKWPKKIRIYFCHTRSALCPLPNMTMTIQEPLSYVLMPHSNIQKEEFIKATPNFSKTHQNHSAQYHLSPALSFGQTLRLVPTFHRSSSAWDHHHLLKIIFLSIPCCPPDHGALDPAPWTPPFPTVRAAWKRRRRNLCRDDGGRAGVAMGHAKRWRETLWPASE